jgi:hypothetical protein
MQNFMQGQDVIHNISPPMKADWVLCMSLPSTFSNLDVRTFVNHL